MSPAQNFLFTLALVALILVSVDTIVQRAIRAWHDEKFNFLQGITREEPKKGKE